MNKIVRFIFTFDDNDDLEICFDYLTLPAWTWKYNEQEFFIIDDYGLLVKSDLILNIN